MNTNQCAEYGWNAHALGLGYHTCTYNTPALRRSWQHGWLQRERHICGLGGVVPIDQRQQLALRVRSCG